MECAVVLRISVIASDPESVEGERGNPVFLLDCFVAAAPRNDAHKSGFEIVL